MHYADYCSMRGYESSEDFRGVRHNFRKKHIQVYTLMATKRYSSKIIESKGRNLDIITHQPLLDQCLS